MGSQNCRMNTHFSKKHIVGRYGGMTLKKTKVYLPNFSTASWPPGMGEWKRLGCAHANLRVVANPTPKVLSWHGIQRLVQVRIFTIPFHPYESFCNMKLAAGKDSHLSKSPLWWKNTLNGILHPRSLTHNLKAMEGKIQLGNHCFQVRPINFGSVPDRYHAWCPVCRICAHISPTVILTTSCLHLLHRFGSVSVGSANQSLQCQLEQVSPQPTLWRLLIKHGS